MTDSTMTEIPLVERLLKISNDEYLALGDENCCAIDEAAAMLKAAVEALEEARRYIANCWIDPVATDEEKALVQKIDNTLASLKQPGGR